MNECNSAPTPTLATPSNTRMPQRSVSAQEPCPACFRSNSACTITPMRYKDQADMGVCHHVSSGWQLRGDPVRYARILPTQDLRRFVTTLFQPDDFVCIRYIETWVEDGNKQSRVVENPRSDYYPARQIASSTFPSEMWQAVAERERANVFLGVCPRFTQSDKYDNAFQIRTVRVIWADVDHCSVEDALNRCEAAGLPRPTVIVNSGNGAHLYWLLAEPYLIDDVGSPPPVEIDWVDQGPDRKKKAEKYFIDETTGERRYERDGHFKKVSPKADVFERIVNGVADKIGGDHVGDMPRLLRMPTTLNRKDQRNGRKPVPCALIECDPTRRYALSEFEKFAVTEKKPFAETKATPTKPTVSLSDDRIIAKARAAKNGSKFSRLWDGDGSEYKSESEADLALAAMLAFWCGPDPTRIENLFQQSGLCRDKWRERQDYREKTIKTALSRTREFYKGEASAAAADTAVPGPWGDPIPFGAGSLPQFPVEVLPEWLRDHAKGVAEATQTPVDLAAMLQLAVLAVALGKKFKVQVKAGYEEPVNLFVVVVLPPANRKSAVYRLATQPLSEYEEAEDKRMQPQIAKAKEELHLEEARLKRLRGEAVDGKSSDAERSRAADAAVALSTRIETTKIPQKPRLLADDATPEKLASLLAEQGGCFAVMSPEGGIFEIMAGRYAEKGDGNFEVFLKGHAGDDLRVDRMSRPTEYIKEATLTLGLTVQPDVITSLASKPGFRGRGLLGRFLYSLPVSLVGRRKVATPPIPDAVRTEYHTKVMWLASMAPSCDAAGRIVASVLTLAPEAYERWQQFAEWLEPQLGEGGELEMIPDWAGKLAGAVARIAGLLHMAEHVHETVLDQAIQAHTVDAAIAIAQYLIPHAQRAFENMGADPAVELAKHVVRWIERTRCKTFSRRDVFQALKGRCKQAAELDPALTVLVEREYVREAQGEKRSGPGRPAGATFETNPKLLEAAAKSASVPGVVDDFADLD